MGREGHGGYQHRFPICHIGFNNMNVCDALFGEELFNCKLAQHKRNDQIILVLGEGAYEFVLEQWHTVRNGFRAPEKVGVEA